MKPSAWRRWLRTPDAEGFAKVQSAVLAHFMGRWQDAERHATEAERMWSVDVRMSTQLALARHIGWGRRSRVG